MAYGTAVDKSVVAFSSLSASIVDTLADSTLETFVEALRNSYGLEQIENLELILPLFSEQLGSASDGHYMPAQAEEAWGHLSVEQKKELENLLKSEVGKARERHPDYFGERN